jgi:hypothetical protein
MQRCCTYIPGAFCNPKANISEKSPVLNVNFILDRNNSPKGEQIVILWEALPVHFYLGMTVLQTGKINQNCFSHF